MNKMKVKLKNILGEYNGKLDDMVFYRERKATSCSPGATPSPATAVRMR